MPYAYSPYGLLIMIAIGVIAGWIAGQVMRGGGFGLGGNLVVGVLGSIIGSYLFSLLGLRVTYGYIGPIIMSSIGAMVLLFVIDLVQKK
jgi:uncharacterized membrane protein YeaQ/YmgE (transglycosylase-associated protein family)